MAPIDVKIANATSFNGNSFSKDDGKILVSRFLQLNQRNGVSYPVDRTEDGKIYIVYDYNRQQTKELFYQTKVFNRSKNILTMIMTKANKNL